MDIHYCVKVIYRYVGMKLDLALIHTHLITAMIAEYRKVTFSVIYQTNLENLNRKWSVETLFLKGVYNFAQYCKT